MPRRLRSREERDDDLGKIVQAARLFFLERQSQRDVAKKMGVSQSTVSRLLKRAEEEQLVSVALRVPSVVQVQSQLSDFLQPSFRHAGVRVVPGGDGKNVDNLGDAGSGLLLDAIKDIQRRKRNVTIAFSSGETLRKVAEDFVNRLRDDFALREGIRADLTLLPAAVFWDPEIKAYYPVTLVTTLWTQLHTMFRGRIHASAPVLPRGYYSDVLWPSDRRKKAQIRAKLIRETMLKESDAADVMERASRADILLLGIGTLGDATYPLLLNAVNVRHAERIWKGRESDAELIYVPFDDHFRVDEKIVRVRLSALETAAEDKARWCIGVGGGALKCAAVGRILDASPPVLNCIVTDTLAAESYLRHRRSRAPSRNRE